MRFARKFIALYLFVHSISGHAELNSIPRIVFSVSPDLPLKRQIKVSAASFENHDMTCNLIIKAAFKQEIQAETFSLLIKNVKLEVKQSDPGICGASFEALPVTFFELLGYSGRESNLLFYPRTAYSMRARPLSVRATPTVSAAILFVAFQAMVRGSV